MSEVTEPETQTPKDFNAEEANKSTPPPTRQRGKVGVASNRDQLQTLWREANHKRVKNFDSDHPNRRTYTRLTASVSLKQFARTLASSGDPKAAVAQLWLDNKAGLNDAGQDEKHLRQIQEIKSAVSLARKKTK